MNYIIRVANEKDLNALIAVGDRLFDHPIKPARAKEFLSDPRHHLVLAYLGSEIIGMASAVHYIHPDKDPSLFINEVGVVEAYQNQKVGRQLVQFLVKYGQSLGCKEAWVATDQANIAAQKAYLAAGGKMDVEPAMIFLFE